MTEWQDIATAPKDGTQILAHDPEYDYLPDEDNLGYVEEEGGYVHPLPRSMIVVWWKEYELGGRWESVHYSAINPKPTHWMPLPSAPE